MSICVNCNKKVFPFQLQSSPIGILHKECFKCSVCSSLLTNQFDTLNGKLYCLKDFKIVSKSSGNTPAVTPAVTPSHTPAITPSHTPAITPSHTPSATPKPSTPTLPSTPKEDVISLPSFTKNVIENKQEPVKEPVKESVKESVKEPVKQEPSKQDLISLPSFSSPKSTPVEEPIVEKKEEKLDEKKEEIISLPGPSHHHKKDHKNHHKDEVEQVKEVKQQTVKEQVKQVEPVKLPESKPIVKEPVKEEPKKETPKEEPPKEESVTPKQDTPNSIAPKHDTPKKQVPSPITSSPKDSKSPDSPASATSPSNKYSRRSLLRISQAQLDAAKEANERALKYGSSKIDKEPEPIKEIKKSKDGKEEITVEQMRQLLANNSFKSSKQLQFQQELAKTKEKLEKLGIKEPVSWNSELAKETAKKAVEYGDVVALAGISVRTGTILQVEPLPEELALAKATKDEIYDLTPEQLLDHVAKELEEKEKKASIQVPMPDWLKLHELPLRKPDGSILHVKGEDLVMYFPREQVEQIIKQQIKLREDVERKEIERREIEKKEMEKREIISRQARENLDAPQRGSSKSNNSNPPPPLVEPSKSSRKESGKSSKDGGKKKDDVPPPRTSQPPVKEQVKEQPKEEKKKSSGLGGLFKKIKK